MKDILKVVFVIIGTMIGAGFASGQEVYLFFFSYGIEGLLGLVISNVIMGMVIYKTFQIVKQYGSNTYKEFLEVLIKKNNKIKSIINNIINIFILITFFIMIAGFGAYFEQELGISSLIRKYFTRYYHIYYIYDKCQRSSKSKRITSSYFNYIFNSDRDH